MGKQRWIFRLAMSLMWNCKIIITPIVSMARRNSSFLPPAGLEERMTFLVLHILLWVDCASFSPWFSQLSIQLSQGTFQCLHCFLISQYFCGSKFFEQKNLYHYQMKTIIDLTCCHVFSPHARLSKLTVTLEDPPITHFLNEHVQYFVFLSQSSRPSLHRGPFLFCCHSLTMNLFFFGKTSLICNFCFRKLGDPSYLSWNRNPGGH